MQVKDQVSTVGNLYDQISEYRIRTSLSVRDQHFPKGDRSMAVDSLFHCCEKRHRDHDNSQKKAVKWGWLAASEV